MVCHGVSEACPGVSQSSLYFDCISMCPSVSYFVRVSELHRWPLVRPEHVPVGHKNCNGAVTGKP